MTATRDSTDGSSVSGKISFRASVASLEPEPSYSETPLYAPTAIPSQAPPPFSSLCLPEQTLPDHLKASITEPDPSPPPAFTSVERAESASRTPSNLETDTKAALPAGARGEPSKSGEDAEPPPPYTEGSSPLDSFTYVMAAAGGPSSIITQVQQSGPAPVNTLSGMALSRQPPTYWW